MHNIKNSRRADNKEDLKIKLSLRIQDTHRIFSIANEKPLIVLEAINIEPKFFQFLTKICERLSHLASQVVHGKCLSHYTEEIVFKVS